MTESTAIDVAGLPGQPAANYELANRLGIGQIFGIKGWSVDMTPADYWALEILVIVIATICAIILAKVWNK